LTVLADSAGAITVSLLTDTTLTLVPRTDPNNTDVPLVKSEPLTVATVPNCTGPAAGDTDDTDGLGSYAYRSRADTGDVPVLVLTLTSTVPAPCAGTVTVSFPDEMT
jgi:hypothetical protein